MRKTISFLVVVTLLTNIFQFGALNTYAAKAEEESIEDFIEDGVKLIRENDANKEFVPEETETETQTKNETEHNSFNRGVTKLSANEDEAGSEEVLSDTSFQTCRLLVKATKTPDRLNSIGMASGFKDWYIVQFKNEKDTKTAYDYYLNKEYIICVLPDTVSAFLCQKQIAETKKVLDGNLNSWGSVETGLYDMKNYIDINVPIKEEIVVGVIDTGIDYNNPYFENRIVRTYFSASKEGVRNDEMFTDQFHGSQVSSIIVDNTNDNVKIACYKWADDNSGCVSSTLLCFLKAINDGVDIINCSFGVEGLVEIWMDAIGLAEEKNIPIFAASGNYSMSLDSYGFTIPASCESVYTVSAYNVDGLPCGWTAYGRKADFLAPGEDLPLIGMNGEIVEGSGTSFSCPMALSLFVQLMTLHPDFSNKRIGNLMKQSAKSSDIFYDCGMFGYGVIDAIGASGIERLESPEISLNSGKYIGEVTITIHGLSDSDIYYTIDGSYPSKENGVLYTSPIMLSDDICFLKAVSYSDGKLKSLCTKEFYRLQRVGTDEMFEISDEGQIITYTGDVYDLIIPETINGITVKSIAPGVFSDSELVGVTFPDTMTMLSARSFSDNDTVMFANGNSIKEIEPYAFKNCKNLYYVDFPSIETIDEYSFRYDSALSGIDFPKCSRIERNAFENCKSLRKINLPSVKSLGVMAFCGCQMICDIDISNAEIFDYRFGNSGMFTASEINMPLDLESLKQVYAGSISNCSINRIEFSNVESIKSLPRSLGIDYLKQNLIFVLPSTLVNCQVIYDITDNVKIYGSHDTYAEEWANEYENVDFIEISQETAVITDLPDEFYDYMRFLYADVVGFNRTYQWYGSYSDKNTGGILIEGANERKFVPKENVQYPYYYCVVTSTDVGYNPIEIRTGASRYMEFNGEIPCADYFALDEILATIPEDLSIYTDESVATLNETINIIDRNLDVSEQSTVDGYVEAISNSLSALKLKEHMVSFIVDNKPILSYELEYGSEITDTPPNPDKTGYAFSKWTPDIPSAMPNDSITFTAEFEPITYYASFMVDGEEIEKVPFTVESTSISEPDVPIKTGCTGKWTEYIIAASDIIINAEYITDEYTVNFIADDIIVKSETVEYGSAIEIPDNPQKDGYIFKKWLPEIPETMPAKDMSFYAVFEEIQKPVLTPSVSIKNYVSVRTVDYKTTIIFTAVTDNMPERTSVVWYKDGEKVTTGEKLIVKEVTEAFMLQAKIVDESGSALSSSEIELVKVKTGLFSKLIAFFRALFKILPVIEQ